ncbi:MAG: Flp pilus assembly complex ATPase component TadA [Clostridiales bacterium]|nr:Flp pilus assembly complex ATPase component TadA [Clostridiales bacterium]
MADGRLSLGHLLVREGIVTPEQVDEALEIQKQTREKLGTILVNKGYCKEEEIARALATKTGFDFMSLNDVEIDPGAVSLIGTEAALKYRAVPISVRGNELYVAMENPNDVVAIDDLGLLTGLVIRPIVVSDTEIESVLNNLINLKLDAPVEEVPEPPVQEEVVAISESVDPPAVQMVNQILSAALRTNASDIHIESQEKNMRVRYRIDGVLHEMMTQPMRMHAAITSRIKVLGGMDISEKRVPQDGRATVRIEDKNVDIRIATLPSAYGESLTIRMLPRDEKIFNIRELGFPQQSFETYEKMMKLPYGFILVTGPTGSGKSTTLYAMLKELNTPDKNIITLEDPIERRIVGINQIQMNEKAGMTFASGLRSILRNDPDIIMVGEIRDAETAKIAVESALTGHLVLSTLHTNNAASSVIRLIEMGVEPYLISSSLAGVLAQRLVRVLCPRCKQPYHLSGKEIAELVPDFPLAPEEDSVTIFKPVGCIHCNNTGYLGRTGIFELLTVTENIRKLVIRDASLAAIQSTAEDDGMITMRADGLNKVRQGITSVEEILRVIV